MKKPKWSFFNSFNSILYGFLFRSLKTVNIYWIIIITKREEWAKEQNQRIDRDITRYNQLDFTKTEFSLDSEEERPLKTKAKLWSTSRTAQIRLEPDSTLEEESPMSSEERTPSTTPNSEFTGALLSTPTVTKEPSESTSRETCHQEPWVPKSESCSTQTNNTERMSE